MYTEIEQTLRYLSASPDTSAIVLTGAGDYYCSGNDLANFSKKLQHPRSMAAEGRRICEAFVNGFVDCEKPLVCAANGPAIGIAVTTMGLCDVRICRPHATFNTPFKELGQAPEGCSSFVFPRLLGAQVAQQMLEGGRKLTAQEALDVGFVQRIVPVEEDLVAVAVELASSPTLKRMTAVEPGLQQKLREVNKAEVTVLESAWISPECFTAVAAYLRGRRKPYAALALDTMNATRFLWDAPTPLLPIGVGVAVVGVAVWVWRSKL